MHVGHMACHVSTCMTLLKAINMGVPIQFVGSSKKKEEEGKREREERKRERAKRKGEMEEKKRKAKKEREEKKKEEKKRKECRTVSRPKQQRTRNCVTRGRFPSTLVILHLGVV